MTTTKTTAPNAHLEVLVASDEATRADRFTLSSGGTLTIDREEEDYYVVVPMEPGMTVDVLSLDRELADYGLARIPEDDYPSELTPRGLVIWCWGNPAAVAA